LHDEKFVTDLREGSYSAEQTIAEVGTVLASSRSDVQGIVQQRVRTSADRVRRAAGH